MLQNQSPYILVRLIKAAPEMNSCQLLSRFFSLLGATGAPITVNEEISRYYVQKHICCQEQDMSIWLAAHQRDKISAPNRKWKNSSLNFLQKRNLWKIHILKTAYPYLHKILKRTPKTGPFSAGVHKSQRRPNAKAAEPVLSAVADLPAVPRARP